MKIKNQKKLIMNRDWDILIVLDACRYDYLDSLYDKYVDGRMHEVRSPGSCTREWLKRVFLDREWKDVVYVSANPFISSKGIKLVDGFEQPDLFYEIVDTWSEYWDNDLKTVPPKFVSKTARRVVMKNPEKKIIAHFIQPHQPYLCMDSDDRGLNSARRKSGKEAEKSL